MIGVSQPPPAKQADKASRFSTVHKANPEALRSQSEAIEAHLESQLYKCLRLFLLISQLFVCAPQGAHHPHEQHGCGPRLLLMLHLLWCLFAYATISTCVYKEYTESDINLPTVQKPLFFSEYLVYLVHIFHIIVATYYARRKFRAFIRTIVRFDQALREFGVHTKYDVLGRFLCGHLLLILLHLVGTAVVSYFYSGCSSVGFVRTTTVYMLPNIILEISLIQYYGLLYAIAVRSVKLNCVLKLQLSRGSLGPLVLQQRNLHQIRSLYSKLELFTAEVNDSFAPSVVLVYIGSFMNISLNIFLIYKYMDDISHSHWAWILYSVIWTLMHIGKMFLILYYNHSVQNQKNTTALVLNDIKGQNPAIEETVTHFILQLIIDTRSNVACGVAALNMEFITSLLVAISTLFIFLLQYDITYEALIGTHKPATPIREY